MEKKEELTESLIRANPNSAEVFEIGHGETNAHYLIRIKYTPLTSAQSKGSPTMT